MDNNLLKTLSTVASLDRSTGEVLGDYADFPQVNRLLFDWISISTRIHDPADIKELLGMTDVPWQIMNSGNGYTHRYFFGDVSISYCEGSMAHVNGFYLLEMSGKGCRTFETYGNGDYNKLFSLIQNEVSKERLNQDVRITRLDIAFDDVTGVFDINQICDKTRLEEFVCRMKTYQCIYGNKGNSVTFGRKGSDVFIRIYDKAKERGYKDSDNKHWIRCELQLRSDASRGFVLRLPDRSAGNLYCSVLRQYLCFKEPSESESNKSRWEDSSWWADHLQNAEGVSLFDRLGVTYNLSKAEKYFVTQPLGTVKSLLAIYGADKFIEKINSLPMPKNPKYRQMISEVEKQLSDAENSKYRPYYDVLPEADFEQLSLSLEEGFEIHSEMTALNRQVLEKTASRKGSRRSKKSTYVPRSVTCIVCGHKGDTTEFWTYRGSHGECYNCRTEKIDLWLDTQQK